MKKDDVSNDMANLIAVVLEMIEEIKKERK